jgi:hypothetical protein
MLQVRPLAVREADLICAKENTGTKRMAIARRNFFMIDKLIDDLKMRGILPMPYGHVVGKQSFPDQSSIK